MSEEAQQGRFLVESATFPSSSDSVGGILKSAREAKNKSLADIADVLKLTQAQVTAIEENKLDLLPGPAFARGFTRNYARYLGVDIDAQLAQLYPEPALHSKVTPLGPPMNVEAAVLEEYKGKKPWWLIFILLLIALAIVLGGYFDWFRIPQNGMAENNVLVSPDTISVQPVKTLGIDDKAPELTPPLSSQSLSDEAGAPLASGLLVQTDNTVVPSVGTDISVKAEVPALQPEVSDSNDAAAAGAENSDAVPATADAAAGNSLTFKPRGESWVQVRGANGETLFSGLLRAGDERVVKGTAPFSLVVGNAAEVSVFYQGKVLDLSAHVRTGVARMTIE